MLRGGTADTVLDALREGSADLAFTSPDPRDREIDWEPLTSERLVVGVPDAHPLAGLDQLTIADLESLEFVALRSGSELRRIADAYFAALGVVPRVVLEVTELETLRALVREGVGVAILPETATGPGIALVPLADEARREIGLATHRSRNPSAAATQFARFAREEFHP